MTDMTDTAVLQQIVSTFSEGAYDEIRTLVRRALAEGGDPARILDDGLIEGLRQVGESFRRGEVYLPDMMMAAEAWQAGMDLLEPLLAVRPATGTARGKVVIGTVKGDIHSLGKNIVVTMLKAANFEVVDLGINVPASRFIEEAERRQAEIIAASALMTTTMPQQRDILEHLTAGHKREAYFVMVGGGCTTAEWAKEIQADAYGETAADAVALAQAHMASLKHRRLA
jgi:corrinoid protein of di/trimethylamine methyltransferase